MHPFLSCSVPIWEMWYDNKAIGIEVSPELELWDFCNKELQSIDPLNDDVVVSLYLQNLAEIQSRIIDGWMLDEIIQLLRLGAWMDEPIYGPSPVEQGYDLAHRFVLHVMGLEQQVS